MCTQPRSHPYITSHNIYITSHNSSITSQYNTSISRTSHISVILHLRITSHHFDITSRSYHTMPRVHHAHHRYITKYHPIPRHIFRVTLHMTHHIHTVFVNFLVTSHIRPYDVYTRHITLISHPCHGISHLCMSHHFHVTSNLYQAISCPYHDGGTAHTYHVISLKISFMSYHITSISRHSYITPKNPHFIRSTLRHKYGGSWSTYISNKVFSF